MASTKISALPQILASATTWNDVVAEVDSGSTTTSKITLKDLMKNGDLIADKSTGYLNFFAAAGIDANSPTIGAEFRGTTFGSAILAGNGYINNSNSSFLAANLEAAGGNSVYLDNTSQSVIMGSFRSFLSGGERSAIIACENTEVSNAYNAVAIGCSGNQYIYQGPSLAAASQGVSINANRAAIIASEGMSLNSNMSASIASYGGTINGNLYQVSLGTFQPTFNDYGGYENMIQIGARESVVEHQRASMISTSGRTSLYSGTSHTDNIHIYGTESKSTITGLTATGSVSVDLSTASVFEFDITGNITDITFTNWREGGIYEFVVHNTGSYTITSSGVRLDGVANTIYAKGGSLNPTNNGYTFYRMMIVNGIGWLNEHLNFQAL